MGVTKLYTLIFVKSNNKVLLGYKTRGLGVDLWNGFGGKVEKNESVLNCAKRELCEECNINAVDLKHIGVVRYDEVDEKRISIVHIFICNKFNGNPSGSEEMNPIKWYLFNDIPYKQMWPDAVEWLPVALKEQYFNVECIYVNGVINRIYVKTFDNLDEALSILN